MQILASRYGLGSSFEYSSLYYIQYNTLYTTVQSVHCKKGLAITNQTLSGR